MFEKQAALFIYALSPVHVGAGQSLGVIDNPIQREKHTNHPCIAGSGIKGAIRHSYVTLGGDSSHIDPIFGPNGQSGNLHAGAVSFGDAQLITMPVKSLKGGFVHVTCGYALGRARRLLAELASIDMPQITPPESGQCVVTNDTLLVTRQNQQEKTLVLDAFEYSVTPAETDKLREAAKLLANLGIPNQNGFEYFHSKMANDLVMLSDTDFAYFAQNGMLVEPHVRINEQTGTAAEGGLFYTENLPPESLLISPLHVGATRTGKQESEQPADVVMAKLQAVLNSRALQIGGDATTGRGLVLAQLTGS